MTAATRFKIIAEPTIRVEGPPPDANVEVEILRSVRKGIASHPRVSGLWETWR
jgi:hypothetical protein